MTYKTGASLKFSLILQDIVNSTKYTAVVSETLRRVCLGASMDIDINGVYKLNMFFKTVEDQAPILEEVSPLVLHTFVTYEGTTRFPVTIPERRARGGN